MILETLFLMPQSHLHIRARPVRATYDNVRKIEYVALSWQFRGSSWLCRVLRPDFFFSPLKSPCVALTRPIYLSGVTVALTIDCFFYLDYNGFLCNCEMLNIV